jgi:hypothetical protein
MRFKCFLFEGMYVSNLIVGLTATIPSKNGYLELVFPKLDLTQDMDLARLFLVIEQLAVRR